VAAKSIDAQMIWTIDPALAPHLKEQQEINALLVAEGAKVGDPANTDIKVLRQGRRFRKDGSSRVPVVEEAEDRVIDSDVGPVNLRVFPQEKRKGTYLHFHGGGWALGSIYEQDVLLWQLARKTGLQVVSIDYPLAPGTRLPAIITHVEAALVALLNLFKGDLICVGGESAGAHLALSAALGVRDRDPALIKRVRALNLCYGIYDLSMTPSQRSWGDQFMALSTPYLEWLYQLCLPNVAPEERRNPALSPLYRDASGMPSTLFTVGTKDPLLDDTLFMAARWQAQGNQSQLNVFPEGPHGFNGLPTAMGRAGNEKIIAFLNGVVSHGRSIN
jgi:acetyl esterase/lipase